MSWNPVGGREENLVEKGAVLVTGASSGIGLETAVQLAARGYRVFASMRDPGRRSALDRRASELGADLDVVKLDVTDEASVREAVDQIVERAGGIYGVVNNAGINVSGFFEELAEDELRQVFQVNLFGTMAVTRAVLPHLRRARRGRVVIIGSVGGKIASPGAAAYCSSKFALEGFGESLAQELMLLGIHVSLIQPGSVKTELFGRNYRRAQRCDDPAQPYHQWSRRITELLGQLSESPAASLSDVASAVEHAMSAPRPRFHYVVGRRTRVLLTLRRYLPGDLFVRIWARETWRHIQASGAR